MATKKNEASRTDDRQTIVARPIDKLLLDAQNPRILAPPRAKQSDLLKLLFETQALEDLAMSFARNGYFLEEPVVVVPHKEDDSQFVVVEGNRRIAALKILLDAKLRSALGAEDWPILSESKRDQLTMIPSVRYERREDVVPYLGFRHITGIRTWDPYAKARYVAGLINAGRSIPEIEESVGDKARTVKRIYQSFVVLRQIEKDLGMDPHPIAKTFSLLEVALSQAPIKTFVGLTGALPTEKTNALIPDDKLNELRELVSWVFGDEEQRQERIITDSRQIPSRLAPVIADPDALKYLRQTRDLEGAYEYSGGEKKLLLRQLAATRRAAQRVLGLLPSYAADEDVRAELKTLRPVLDALRSALGK